MIFKYILYVICTSEKISVKSDSITKLFYVFTHICGATNSFNDVNKFIKAIKYVFNSFFQSRFIVISSRVYIFCIAQ